MMPKRKWFQFSLRGCLVVTTGLCIWLGWQNREANRQREAIRRQKETTQALRDMGAELILGDDDIAETVLFLRNRELTDESMALLTRLPTMRRLIIVGVPITDAGLMRLEGLANLRMLRLHDTNVTETGVESLRDSLKDCTIECNPPARSG